MKKQTVLATLLALASTAAMAHPGHGLETGFASGFMHPLTGLDHLLVMIAVGVWAGKIGDNARWQLPLMFVVVMTIGASLGQSGMVINGLETWVSATVIAMGALLAITLAIPRWLQLACIGMFAVVHGLAHGAELQHQSMPLLGMLMATGVLHLIGLWMSRSKAIASTRVQNAFAFSMMLLGGYWLI